MTPSSKLRSRSELSDPVRSGGGPGELAILVPAIRVCSSFKRQCVEALYDELMAVLKLHVQMQV